MEANCENFKAGHDDIAMDGDDDSWKAKLDQESDQEFDPVSYGESA